MKKGALDQTTSDMKLDESVVIARLKDGEQYKFVGVQENLKQEDKLVLNCAAEVYLKRVSVIWSSPLSDHNRITVTNQFALLVHERHEGSWWRVAESTHWGQRRYCTFRERWEDGATNLLRISTS